VFTSISASFSRPGGQQMAAIDWGDGTSVDVPVHADGLIIAQHSYIDNGSYTVSVSVDDASGVVTDTLTITVTNVAPVVGQVADRIVRVGDVVHLETTLADPGLADTHVATIDWGDGSVTTPRIDNGVITASYAYGRAGEFSAAITVMDDDGGSTVRSFVISVTEGDTTPPVITPSIVGTPGQSGWYTSAVHVTWSVVDPESPVTTTGCAPWSSPAGEESVGQVLTCQATSGGGTASAAVTIRIDLTPPTIAIDSPAPTTSALNQPVNAVYGCLDGMSKLPPPNPGAGSPGCVGSVVNGAAIDTSTPGAHTMTVVATDRWTSERGVGHLHGGCRYPVTVLGGSRFRIATCWCEQPSADLSGRLAAGGHYRCRSRW
jgi:hypothetical protein